MATADRPLTKDELEYHLHTRPGDLAPLCLIVGAPGRAEMIAETFLVKRKRFANDHRGLVSYTGEFQGVRVSVTTSGMGVASLGIVLPEAVRSGARVFIRVGSCGSLISESLPGDTIIVTGAIRYDGATIDWAPIEYPAIADWRVVEALVAAAKQLMPRHYFTGIEATTSDFNTGQGRPNLHGDVPPRMMARHQEVQRLRVSCYSMEAAGLFVWCATEGWGLPSGVINAVYANRVTGAWEVAGDENAASVALLACKFLAQDPAFAKEYLGCDES